MQLNFVFCCTLQKECIVHVGLQGTLGSRSHWRVKKSSETCCMQLRVVLLLRGSGTVRVALDGQGKQWCMYASSMSSPRVWAGQGHLLSLGGEVEKGPVKMPCVDGWRSTQVVYAGNIQTLTSCWEWQGQGHLSASGNWRQRKVFASGIAWFAARASRVQIPGYSLEIV